MKSVIIGAGKYGTVYLALLREAGVDVIGFLDDKPASHGTMLDGVPVLGPVSMLECLRDTHGIEAVYCPLGNNRVRVKLLSLAARLGYETPCYIHPSVTLSPDVTIGKGVYILQGSNIMPHTVINDYVMISMGVNVAHHNIIESGTFLSTGCNFGASIHAKAFTYCGIGSTIMTGVDTLGSDCLIGAGAVVIHDVPDGAVMAGVPAKPLRINKPQPTMGGGNTLTFSRSAA